LSNQNVFHTENRVGGITESDWESLTRSAVTSKYRDERKNVNKIKADKGRKKSDSSAHQTPHVCIYTYTSLYTDTEGLEIPLTSKSIEAMLS
jgi:hypothetical protein